MPMEKKKISVKELLGAEFEQPLVPSKLLKVVAFENLVRRQYRSDPEFRDMYIKLKNALMMQKIGAGQLKEYFREALRQSVDRMSVKWVDVKFYKPKHFVDNWEGKKEPGKKAGEVKKKAARKKKVAKKPKKKKAGKKARKVKEKKSKKKKGAKKKVKKKKR